MKSKQLTSRSMTRVAQRHALGSVGILAVLVCVSAAAGGAWWWYSQQESEGTTDAILHQVKLDDFRLEVTERGEIMASGVTEVRSLVKSKNATGVAIMQVVPEGTEVKEGDFLVELDSSALEEERTMQRIAYNTAQAAMIESQNIYETALISKREYLEGTFVQERQLYESEVFVAEENLNRAREYVEFSRKLATKGYVNQLQLEADQFAVEKSSKELDAARTTLRVLEEFTREKMVKQLESDIAISEAKWEADKNSFQLEREKLYEIEDQIAKCTITAPRDGVVVYAHQRDRRGDNNFIVEEGALIRERQTIIEIPDPTSMQVELTINESMVQYIQEGLPAKIVPVGFGDRVLRGKVINVNQYAEPTGWRKANVKEYKALVSLPSPPPGMRPGMTASVTILCEEIDDALQVPVQSVHAHGGDFYCLVFKNGKWEPRKVTCGPTNDRFFVIEEGLEENDRVAMNPRRYLSYVNLPRITPERAQRAVAMAPDIQFGGAADDGLNHSTPELETAELSSDEEAPTAGG